MGDREPADDNCGIDARDRMQGFDRRGSGESARTRLHGRVQTGRSAIRFNRSANRGSSRRLSHCGATAR